ncbi:MAG: hypothetical protein BGO30_08240 [Bacteroidetes bacterium 41-46]|nr:MAG: hypothetical protein BGO30_08240 [Bacteroidetes bacterium 41-46]
MAKSTTIVINSDAYTYPSREERAAIYKDYPEIPSLKFTQCEVLPGILSKSITLQEANKIRNLYFWSQFLSNRHRLVHESFVIAITNYNRGVSDPSERTQSESQFANRWKFDYYAETFYYFLISSQDQLAQLLNTYFDLNIPEDHVSFGRRLFSLIDDGKVVEVLKDFQQKIFVASRYRNKFAHRFSPTTPDFRSTILEINGKTGLGLGGGHSTSADEIAKNMKLSVKALSELMGTLSNLVKE